MPSAPKNRPKNRPKNKKATGKTLTFNLLVLSEHGERPKIFPMEADTNALVNRLESLVKKQHKVDMDFDMDTVMLIDEEGQERTIYSAKSFGTNAVEDGCTLSVTEINRQPPACDDSGASEPELSDDEQETPCPLCGK